MRLKSKPYRFLAYIMAFAIILSSTLGVVVLANSDEDALEAQKKALEKQIVSEQKELEKLKGDETKQNEYLSAAQDQLDNMEKRMSSVMSGIGAIEGEIKKLDQEMETLGNTIGETEKSIAAKGKEIEGVIENLQGRLRVIYMNGNATTLEVLLNATSLSSLLTRAEAMKGIAEQDQEMIAELKTHIAELGKKQEELAAQQNKLQTQRDEFQDKETKLNLNLLDLSTQREDIEKQHSEVKDVLSSMNKQSQAYKDQIAKIRDQMSQVEMELAQGGSNSGDGSDTSVEGKLYTPIQDPGRYVTSPFGFYPGTTQVHRGLDISCSNASGTPIYAAESGTVTASRYHWQLGNYVEIDHGGGFKTQYAHGLEGSLLMKEGQYVSRGQQISRVGNTGQSFGAHLHFVLLLDNVHIDPRPYLEYIPNNYVY